MLADLCKSIPSSTTRRASGCGRSLAALAIAAAAIGATLHLSIGSAPSAWAQSQTDPAPARPAAKDGQPSPSATMPGASAATPAGGTDAGSGQPGTTTGPEARKDGAAPASTGPAATGAAPTTPIDTTAAGAPPAAAPTMIEDPSLTALRLMIVLGGLPKGADIRIVRDEMLPLPGAGATSERSGGLDPADIARLSSAPRPGLPPDPSIENPTARGDDGRAASAAPGGNEPGAIGPRTDGSNTPTGAAVGPPSTQRTDGTRAPTGQVLSAGDQRPREVLVVFAETAKVSAPDDVAATVKLDREANFESALSGRRIVRYRIADDRSLPQVLDLLGKDARILSAQPNYVYKPLQGAGGKAAPAAQYSTRTLRLTDAHRLARGRNVKIAVIDTGVDTAHPELAGLKIETFDATGSGRVRAEAHGTAMLGILAARKQLVGTAPDATLLVARAIAPEGEGTTESVIKALAWSFGNGARIVNLSLSGPKDPLLQQEIATAIARGATVVAAAGNGGEAAPPAFPAAYEGVIAVTAVDANDKVYADANRGGYIALAAPGVDVPALAPNRSYTSASGTSYAAAHVSGVIALLLERKPELKASEIRDLLGRTARKPSVPGGQGAKDTGSGVIDPVRALESLR